MAKKTSHFDLYSDQTKELIKLWSDLRPGSSFDARHFLVGVLRDLEESSLRHYEKPSKKKKDYETGVQDTLSGSAGYAAEIIEHRLRETIEDHLEVQRASPGKMREDIATEMTEQFLMLALECFIAGSAAGKFKLLSREYDLLVADNRREGSHDYNAEVLEENEQEAELWRSEAESIIDELMKNPRTRHHTKNKSEIARRVKEKLGLEVSDRTVKRRIYPEK
jgi:hypothetical protein